MHTRLDQHANSVCIPDKEVNSSQQAVAVLTLQHSRPAQYNLQRPQLKHWQAAATDWASFQDMHSNKQD